MSEDVRLDKNKRIAESKKATVERHKKMNCKVYTVKIQSNKLTKKQKESLKMIFVEAKWFKNYVLNWHNLNKKSSKLHQFDTSIKPITHKDKDGNDVEVELKHLSSQMKQCIIKEMIANEHAIKTLIRNGYQHGGMLKFVSEIKSIALNQYNVTYKIKNKKYIKIQGIKGWMKVNGLEQILSQAGAEVCNARLLNKPDGHYIQIVVYINKQDKEIPNEIIGLDFGIESALTFSDGTKIDVEVQESESLKRLQKKLSRQEKGSKNRNKTINKIQCLYQKQTNIKENISNQIVSFLLNNFKTVVIQDEMIANWHKGLFGKKIQHSILGRVKSKLKQSNQTIVLSKSFATTKTCSCCGQKMDMKLSDRVFRCEHCNIKMDRDVHAAQNMIWFYEKSFKVPTEHRDFKPVEIETSAKLKNLFNNVSYMSMKQEAAMSLA